LKSNGWQDSDNYKNDAKRHFCNYLHGKKSGFNVSTVLTCAIVRARAFMLKTTEFIIKISESYRAILLNVNFRSH